VGKVGGVSCTQLEVSDVLPYTTYNGEHHASVQQDWLVYLQIRRLCVHKLKFSVGCAVICGHVTFGAFCHLGS